MPISHSTSNVKTALVLAGGGLTGAVYEIGALRAIDDLLVDVDTSSFDIYVGTSAGAIIASFLANGIKPAELMRGLDNQHPIVRGPRRSDISTLNTEEFVSRAASLPSTVYNAVRYYLHHRAETRPVDILYSIGETLPSGLYDNNNLARYIYNTLIANGGSNNFKALDRELYIIATDLDTGHRAVFGEGDLADVPISLSVAASAAVPLLYRPVRIGNRDYIDGGVRGNASLDVAIEHGAKLIVVVNSVVPIDNSSHNKVPIMRPNGRYLKDKGLPAVAAQVYRTFMHAGLVYHVKQIQRQHPDVTIIHIEPDRTDQAMFFFDSMRYSARMTIAQHGYESVTVNLAQDYHRYKANLAKYGIAITPRLVNEELEIIRRSGGHPDTIRMIMENATTRPRVVPSPVERLRSTLDGLTALVDQRETKLNIKPTTAAKGSTGSNGKRDGHTQRERAETQREMAGVSS